jgi:hypothetical protein
MGKTLKDGANFRTIAKQLGSRGGKKVLKKFENKHFSAMANNRWKKWREERASEQD